jgi:phosphoglycolate phosphatase-like HAD superfamily hydrolase
VTPRPHLVCVLFDLDGTLVDTLPVCYLAFREALVRAGAPAMTDAEIHALFGPSEEGMFQRALPNAWERALPAYFAAYVGDARADMLAAREAGVVAAGAAWAHGARVAELKEAGADVIFADAREFVAWLDAATRGVDAPGIATSVRRE